MSKKEYEIKCENLFKKNTILLNQQKTDAERIGQLVYLHNEDVNTIKLLNEQIAELKKDNEGYEKDNTLLVSQFNQTSAKLTKAIKILKKYHNECPSKYSFEDIDDMAEQFLKNNA